MRPDTLIILHGWGGKPQRWEKLVKEIRTKNLRVVVPPLPVDKVRRTDDFADWLNEITRTRPPFFLLGHSFGGQIAINFAARYPHRIKKLILIGSAGIRYKSVKARLFLPLAKQLRFLPKKLKLFSYRLIGETDYINSGPVMKETMKLILSEDQQINLKKIVAPTLLIWGENDRYTPLKQGQLMQKLIPNSRLEVFPRGSHGLPFTHFIELKNKILWFLK